MSVVSTKTTVINSSISSSLNKSSIKQSSNIDINKHYNRNDRTSDNKADNKANLTIMHNFNSLIKKLNEKLNILDVKIELQLDRDTKETVVKIIDKNTGKVIRQIPPEELLKIDSAFKDVIRGVLLNKKI